MEKISKVGKNFDETLEELLSENKLTNDDVIVKTGEKKKSLFKGESIEVIIYKKDDIYVLAKDYLKQIVEALGLEVSFEIKTVEGRTTIKMYSNNNNILIGHNGNTIKALEVLVRQKIQLETGSYIALSLDVENYKDKKNSRIERLAKQTAKDVVRTGTVAKMENMNAYERRIVHNALTNFKGVTTKSEGEEPHRHVVISPEK